MQNQKLKFVMRDREWHPASYTPIYKTTVARSPKQSLVSIQELNITECSGPEFLKLKLGQYDNDLILNYSKQLNTNGLPVGERIIVHGRVIDQFSKPVPNTLVEIWQANAGGRYRHKKDQYLAPLDPNFGGVGRTLTDDQGYYRFRTVKPGPYPWRNNTNSWRPAHIHVSIMGPSISTRLITQLYFEGDPLIPLCPIINTIEQKEAIETLVAKLDMSMSRPMDCLAYRFDIVTRGCLQTYFEE